MSEKTKSIAKFDGLEPRRCEDIKEIVASEIDPKCLGTFEKQASGLIRSLLCIIDWDEQSKTETCIIYKGTSASTCRV